MPGEVQVSVFTNFEGWLNGANPIDVDTAANAAAWFRDCAAAFPEIVWTHLYSPRYLLVQDSIDAVFTPTLTSSSPEATAKFVPRASGVAPSGSGCPGTIFGVIMPPYSSVRDTSVWMTSDTVGKA
jgi:hypothetical protein